MYNIKIPFLDLNKMYNSGQCFSWTKIDENKYFIVDGDWATTITELDKDKQRYNLSCSEEQWFEHWYNYFDMDTDYLKIFRQVTGIYLYADWQSNFMEESFGCGFGIRILRQDPWQTIITFMISQNNNMKRIRKSVDMIKQQYGFKVYNTKDQYYFPTYLQLVDADLESCGVGYRAEYLDEICQFFFRYDDGTYIKELNNLNTEDLINSILGSKGGFKGIGKKVAAEIALCGFHRLEVAPIDVHMKRIIDTYFNHKNPLEQFKGYEGLIQQWMFDYETNK